MKLENDNVYVYVYIAVRLIDTTLKLLIFMIIEIR